MAINDIDPRAIFLKLACNPNFMEPIANHFNYEMQDLVYSDQKEEYINQMVTCENKSRKYNQFDHLSNLKQCEFSNINVASPLNALHMILHGISFDFSRPTVISKTNIQMMMNTMYELEKRIEWEPRTNYLCCRGMFPVQNRKNMSIARACLDKLDQQNLWMLLALVSNINHRPSKVY